MLWMIARKPSIYKAIHLYSTSLLYRSYYEKWSHGVCTTYKTSSRVVYRLNEKKSWEAKCIGSYASSTNPITLSNTEQAVFHYYSPYLEVWRLLCIEEGLEAFEGRTRKLSIFQKAKPLSRKQRSSFYLL